MSHEPDIWTVFQSALSGPAIALFVILILGAVAVSGKFSIALARILLLAALVVAGLGLWGQPFWLLVPAIAVTAAALIALGWFLRPAVIPQYIGRLLPRRTLFMSSRISAATPVFEIGDSGTRFVWAGPVGQQILNYAGMILTIETIARRVYISTILKDINGRIIVELFRNEWRVSPPPHTWDRNYNRDTLEVRNPEGRVVLQVRILLDRIQLQGEWWNNANEGIRMVKARDKKGAFFVRLGREEPEGSPQIEPLFRYPSDSNLGCLR